MKKSKILLLSFLFIGLSACSKNETDEINNIDVENYIELLKTNQYDYADLPAFTHADIPALLNFRNDTQTITNFPCNLISSLYLKECKLGMYVLWTIESIRAVSINSEYLIGRFPSQNPVVQKREGDFELELGDEVHRIVSQAYFDWWEENDNNNFDDFNAIDPLLETEYRWH